MLPDERRADQEAAVADGGDRRDGVGRPFGCLAAGADRGREDQADAEGPQGGAEVGGHQSRPEHGQQDAGEADDAAGPHGPVAAEALGDRRSREAAGRHGHGERAVPEGGQRVGRATPTSRSLEESTRARRRRRRERGPGVAVAAPRRSRSGTKLRSASMIRAAQATATAAKCSGRDAPA